MVFKKENGSVYCTDDKGTFGQYEPMQDIADSMLLDSDTLIADYETKQATVTLEVRGAVHVEYKGEVYTRPSDFPKELVDLISKGKGWEFNDDVYVGNNNWFEIFLWANGEYIFSEVVDAEKLSTEELYNMLRKFYDENEKELVA